MHKIVNSRFQETYYEETLENGLKVVLWEKPGYKKSFFLLGTPYGALDIKQVDHNGKIYEFPCGSAHFLEHKMFEKQDQDIMELFTEMGASCNAFTSYSETAYYFSTSENPIQPLQLLLDFVQKLEITDSSVEKEKGIIVQELEMYIQMSESRMINETMASLYKYHPLRYDIGGDKESVMNTTKEDLENCYRMNYHPSNMILVGVSGYDCEKLMEIIKTNQSKKVFHKKIDLQRVEVNEPYEVYKKEHTIAMDVSSLKVCYAYKLKGIKDPVKRNKKEWAYKLLMDMYFSSVNPQYQIWIDDEIINNSFTFEIDFGEDYGLLLFYSETEKKEEFYHIIKDTLSTINSIDNAVLEQLKRRYFGVSSGALGSMKQIAITFMRTYFAKQDFFASIEDLESINEKDILEVLHEIDLNNYSCICIEPKKE